jgi:pyruvate dehydrogenase E1 component alpha subunit
MYHATSAAVARARAGEGPSFLECRTFRWRGHVGASSDIDVGVKRRGELQEWIARDPIVRLQIRLGELGVHDLDEREIREEIQTAVDRARAAAYPPAERVFDHVFANGNQAEAACAS